MGFLTPKAPLPPPPPPPPPPPAVKPAQTREASRAMKRLQDPKRMSRARTIVTGPRGLTDDSGENVYTRTLLGSVRKND